MSFIKEHIKTNCQKEVEQHRQEILCSVFPVFFFCSCMIKKEKRSGRKCFFFGSSSPLLSMSCTCHMCVCIKRDSSRPLPSLACLPHQETDWAITDGDVLKRLVCHFKKQATRRPPNPAADVSPHLPMVQEPGFTCG